MNLDILNENLGDEIKKSESNLPPSISLIQMMTSMWVSQAIYVAAYLGIADLLKDSPKNINELADKTGTHAPSLYRVIRALASIDIFTEIEPKKFALTQTGHYLRSDVPDSLRSLSIMLSDRWSWQSWGEILQVVKTGETPFPRLYQVDDIQAYFEKNPESSKVFDDAMTNFTQNTINAPLLDTYDFSRFSKVVDLGGGHGTLIASILKAYPQMKGVLFDLPNVVANASSLLEKEGVAERCEIVAGDFFKSVYSGGDAYVISQIIHSWDDDSCINLLKNIRSAMTERSTLIIINAVIPPNNKPHFNKWLDIELLIAFPGGRERMESEFSYILEAAGLRLTKIIPTASDVSVIEAECI